MAESAGDVEKARVEQMGLNQTVQKYGEFSKAAGLRTKYERMYVAGYHPVSVVDASFAKLRRVTTSNGIKIQDISNHTMQRAAERKITGDDVLNALTKPLNIGKIITDSEGRNSQRFIGEFSTVNINPDTGVISTIWKTSSKLVEKYKGGNKHEN